MKTILVTCGPIPGRLDSVKYITNRFKGGLSFRTAQELSFENKVTILKWKYTDITGITPFQLANINVVNINDVYDYYNYIASHQFDCYILAAAVANLIPSNPWEGKFPSHNFKEGDVFEIKFTIAPRAIDIVKQKWPKSTLIGYKLFDGTEEELIKAGFETLNHSRANCVFANHPATAKNEKIVLLPDGSAHKMDWDQHINFIKRVINLQWYTTETYQMIPVEGSLVKNLQELLDRIKVHSNGYYYGTVAIKIGGNIISSTRGKRGSGWGKNMSVDHENRIMKGDKMTLNIPFLDLLYKKVPGYPVILHAHNLLEDCPGRSVVRIPHYFDGTSETVEAAEKYLTNDSRWVYVENHGYYAMFESLQEASIWLQ